MSDSCAVHVITCDRRRVDRTPPGWIGLPTLCALVLATVSGCAEIPRQELTTYVEAYSQARSASEQVLTDLVASRERIESYRAEEAAGDARSETRDDYVPPTKRGSASGTDAITVRLAALALVSEYNSILVAIAEGNGMDTLRGKVQGAVESSTSLLSLMGTTVPGAGALTGLLQTVASEAQRHMDRQAFAHAMRDGAPLVKEILQSLIDETPLIVRVHEGIWDAESASLEGQAFSVVRAIRAEARRHGPPASDSPEEARVAELEAKLSEQLDHFGRDDVTLRFAGTAPVTSEVLGQLEADLPQLEAAVQAFVESQRKSPALRDLMDQYVLALSTTQDALDSVSLALDRPVDFARVAAELLEAAISIKREYATYKAALSAP